MQNQWYVSVFSYLAQDVKSPTHYSARGLVDQLACGDFVFFACLLIRVREVSILFF
jgi:hypothetical protein